MKHILRTSLLFSVISISAAAVAAPVGAATPDATVRCNGTLPSGTYGNVLVPPGATCSLGSGVTITGNLKAQSGSVLSISGTSIGKNFTDQSGASLAQSSATIGGLELINGLTSTPGGGPNTVCGTSIGKDAKVQALGTSAALVFGDTSGGVCAAANTISRSGEFDRNSGPLDVSNNTFNRDLIVDNNSSIPLVVANNTIGNTCEQHGNQPGSVFSGNKAKRNEGC